MAAVETFNHIPVGTVTAGGTTTSDTAWTVTVTAAFPAASGTVQFHVCDPAASTELILVTASPGGTGAGQSWTVVRGADGTTAVSHAAGFTIYQVVPASWLNGVVAAGTPLTTLGDLLYENATPALARLAGNTTATKKFLTQTGTGSISAAPGWNTITSGDLPAVPGYLVGLAPSGDTTGATDYANITGLFNLTGDCILQAGTFWVNQVLQIPGGANWDGVGDGLSIVKMAAAANLGAVAASAGWTASTNTSSVLPAFIRGITFDGNISGQSSGANHGLVLQTFYSYIEDCQFQNTGGDGLRFDYYGANGTTNITNTAVENRVYNCQFRANGGRGVNVNDPSFGAYTDGWIVDCVVSGPGADAINIGAGAGWHIDGNHVYGGGIPFSGIAVSRPFATKITGNYIESYGASGTAGTYCGIDFGLGATSSTVNDTGVGSVISGNVIRMTAAAGSASSVIMGIGVKAANSAQATVAISGNMIVSGGGLPTGSAAIELATQNAAATVIAQLGANVISGTWAAGNLVQTGGGTFTVTSIGPGAQIDGPLTVQQATGDALIVSTDGTATSTGALVADPAAGWVGLYNGGTIYGISTVLPAPAGTATVGGYYHGLGIGGNSNNTNNPIFGVLTSTQSGNGLGNTAFTIYDNNGVFTFNNSVDDGHGNAAVTGNLKLAAGTATLAPLTLQSGTNLTTATAGDAEYDGASAYFTNETTSGRGLIPVEQKFRLTATGTPITTIANFFGTTSNISLVANAEYEIEIDCWFLKNTAGTVTWTFTNSSAPTSMNLAYKLSPATGIVSTAANTALFGEQYNITATAPTVVSASLTTAVNHHHQFWIRLINGSGTSLKIQATAGAGSITPGINSAWKCRRVPAANVGTFSA